MSRLKWKFGALCVFVLCFSTSGIFGEGREDTSLFAADVDPNTAYCFRFTWLGPKWDNTSQVNGTCDDFGKVPCKEPLIVTRDSTPPNTTYMWHNFDLSQIACRLTKGEVCTKWVQYYANEVEFITYMCSKYAVNGHPRTDWEGCESDSTTNDTFTNEVCACRSAMGSKPCNDAAHQSPLTFLLIIGILAVLFSTVLAQV